MTIAEQLKQTELFKEVELVDLSALVTRMEQHLYPPGAVLFNEGEAGDTMYIIQAGKIRIYTQGKDGEDIVLTHYSKNEIFGELSPIDQRPRSASAAAVDDLEVLSLDRQTFLNILNERPQIGLAMMRSLSQRLRNTTTFVEDYKPGREAVVAPSRQALSRHAAKGLMADLLDRVGDHPAEENEQEKIEVPSPVEVPYKAQIKAQTPPPPAPPPNLARQGIFDALGDAIQERDKEKKE